MPPVTAPPASAQETFDLEVSCHGRPIVELVGPQGAFLFTDAGELLSVGPEAKVLTPFAAEARSPSTRLALASAVALDADGAPVLGTPARQIAWLRRGAWEVLTHAAPVLALGSSRGGVVAGDSAGELTVFDGRRVSGIHAGEPVVALCAADEYIGALGAEGGLWVTRWPHEDSAALLPIETSRMGRAFGLFAGPNGALGVFGAQRAAIVDLARGRVTATSPDLGDIRAVTCLEGGAGYAVLTDLGELTALDPALRSPRPIPLPSKGDAAVGVRPVAAGALLVWTSAGELFHVRRDGVARRLAGDGVVLAYPTSADACVVAHATATGVRLRTERWS